MNNWSHERSDMDGHWVLKDEAEQRIAELEGSLEEWVLDGKAMEERIAELEAQIENVREIHGRKVVELMHENRELDRRIAEMKADITEWEQENTVIINKLDALLERLESLLKSWRHDYDDEKFDELSAIIKEARDE